MTLPGANSMVSICDEETKGVFSPPPSTSSIVPQTNIDPDLLLNNIHVSHNINKPQNNTFLPNIHTSPFLVTKQRNNPTRHGNTKSPLKLAHNRSKCLREKLNTGNNAMFHFNRRMSKCNSVLQTEKDLFQPEVRPNLSENCHFSTFFRTPKSSKTFGHSPVKISYFGIIHVVSLVEESPVTSQTLFNWLTEFRSQLNLDMRPCRYPSPSRTLPDVTNYFSDDQEIRCYCLPNPASPLDPYDLILSDHVTATSNTCYYAASPLSVLSFDEGGLSGVTSVGRWVWERDMFYSLRKLSFFKQARQRKVFNSWTKFHSATKM